MGPTWIFLQKYCDLSCKQQHISLPKPLLVLRNTVSGLQNKDLCNPEIGLLSDGMFGLVTLLLSSTYADTFKKDVTCKTPVRVILGVQVDAKAILTVSELLCRLQCDAIC